MYVNSDRDVFAASEKRDALRMVNSTAESRNPNVKSNWCQDSTTKSKKNSNFQAKKIFFETYMKRGDIFDNTVGHSASTVSMTSLILDAQEPSSANGRADNILSKKSHATEQKGSKPIGQEETGKERGEGPSQWERSLENLARDGRGAEPETRV